jgi:hypothetical protein
MFGELLRKKLSVDIHCVQHVSINSVEGSEINGKLGYFFFVSLGI